MVTESFDAPPTMKVSLLEEVPAEASNFPLCCILTISFFGFIVAFWIIISHGNKGGASEPDPLNMSTATTTLVMQFDEHLGTGPSVGHESPPERNFSRKRNGNSSRRYSEEVTELLFTNDSSLESTTWERADVNHSSY